MTKHHFTVWLWACLIIVLFIPGLVCADTVYVDQNEGPITNIADAIISASVGDTVLVGPGYYDAFTVTKKLNIISEEGPGKTSITSAGPVTFAETGSYSMISGFTITIDAGDGILISEHAHYIRIENNIISSCSENGIHINADNSLLEYTSIQNNTIAFNKGEGIYLHVYSSSYGGSIRHCAITNNILFKNSNYGIRYNYPGSAVCTVANNIFFGNIMDSVSGVTADISTGNLFTDPLFIDTEISDFHLQAGSLAIDAGMAGAVYNDPDSTRNDMGVYGGPGAAGFWPNPAGGPIVTNIAVTPPSVPVGGTISLTATGKIP